VTADEQTVEDMRNAIRLLPRVTQAEIEVLARVFRLIIGMHADTGAMALALVGAEMAAGIPVTPEEGRHRQ
jgi:hypothetical protein